jgi:hypothetical protein
MEILPEAGFSHTVFTVAINRPGAAADLVIGTLGNVGAVPVYLFVQSLLILNLIYRPTLAGR